AVEHGGAGVGAAGVFEEGEILEVRLPERGKLGPDARGIEGQGHGPMSLVTNLSLVTVRDRKRKLPPLGEAGAMTTRGGRAIGPRRTLKVSSSARTGRAAPAGRTDPDHYRPDRGAYDGRAGRGAASA